MSASFEIFDTLDFLMSYEDLPSLIPDYEDLPLDYDGYEPLQGIERENPVKDIMVGWEYADKKFIEQVALCFFYERFPGLRIDSSKTESLISQLLQELEKQETEPIIFLQTCCTNPTCTAINFIDCVLTACKLVFQETEFF